MVICQLGCGEHARGAHGPSQRRLAAERAELRLAGCCDIDRERSESFRGEFGYARAWQDPGAMLDTERPDAVVVAVPIDKSVAVGSLVLERGIPLLLEKPPGATVADTDRLIAVADASGAPVPHQVAFTPVAGVLVERAAAHAHGHSLFLNIPMWGGVDSPGRLVQYQGGKSVDEVQGDRCGDGTALFELGGFYRETASFLDAVRERRTPSPGLRESRQSVEVAQRIRERRGEYRA